MRSNTIDCVDEVSDGEADQLDTDSSVSPDDSGWRPGLGVLGVTAAGLALVWLHGVGVGVDSLHVLGLDETLNDQVVYVDAARHLLAAGELTTGLIYPSTLLQEFGRNFLYMPGHATAIALSVATFGDSPVSAMVPSIVAYLVCLGCLYGSGRRLAGSRAGFAAASLFATTPILLVYTWSAMAEMTTLAACLVAFTIFVHLEGASRAWLAPLLLIGPFLFRETAAFWIVPMALLLIADSQGTRVRRWRAAAIASVASVLTLGFVYRLPWIADRPSLFAQNLLGRTYLEKYADAYSLSRADLDVLAIARATFELGGRNLVELFHLLSSASYESITMHVLLWVPLVGALVAWRSLRLRPLVLAWAGLFVVTFVFATLLYRWNFFIGVRQLLPPAMLGMLVVGAALAESVRHLSARALAIGAVAVWLLACGVVVFQTGLVKAGDQREEMIRSLLAKITIPERGVFIAHHNVGLVRLLDQPLALVSFPPANRPTLERLEARFDVRAALLQDGELQRSTPAGLRAVGLRNVGRISGFRFLRESDDPGRSAP